MVKPGASYVIMDVNGTLIMVGKERAKAIAALVNVSDVASAKTDEQPNIVAEFNADDLLREQARAHHPFIPNFTVPLVAHEARCYR